VPREQPEGVDRAVGPGCPRLRTRLIRQHSTLDNRHEHSIVEISHGIRTTRLRDTSSWIG